MIKIIEKSCDELIPYENNARINDKAVDVVANSIKEFGFKNPIIIDKNGVIVAGHTRVEACKKLGIDKVPCIIADDLPESYRRNGIKDCFCEDCGTEFSVRKDTHPKVCRHCTSVRGGRALKGKRAETRECRECGKEIYKSSKNTFCSVKCRNDNLRVERICKECGISFEVTKSSISSKTNATGNYCSRKCYEKHLCRTDRITGRGSQWKKRREEVLAIMPFCAICGTTKNLQVHHITPFRITHDNKKENLIPLCTKHHKHIELMFVDAEKYGVNKTTEMIWRNILRTQQLATLAVIRGICCDR